MQARRQLLDALLGGQPLPGQQGRNKANRGSQRAGEHTSLDPAAPGGGKAGRDGLTRGKARAKAGAKEARFGALCLLPVPGPADARGAAPQPEQGQAAGGQRTPHRPEDRQHRSAPGSPVSPGQMGVKRPASAGSTPSAQACEAHCASPAQRAACRALVPGAACSPGGRAALAPLAALAAAPRGQMHGSVAGCTPPAQGQGAAPSRGGSCAPSQCVGRQGAGGRSSPVQRDARDESTSPGDCAPLVRADSDTSMRTCTPGTPAELGGRALASAARRACAPERSLLAPGRGLDPRGGGAAMPAADGGGQARPGSAGSAASMERSPAQGPGDECVQSTPCGAAQARAVMHAP